MPMPTRKTPRELVKAVWEKWQKDNPEKTDDTFCLLIDIVNDKSTFSSELRAAYFSHAVKVYLDNRDPFRALTLIMFADNHCQ